LCIAGGIRSEDREAEGVEGDREEASLSTADYGLWRSVVRSASGGPEESHGQKQF